MAGMNYHYYNEFDPYAAQWLRNLMAAGRIPEGCVDTRSIVDVQPEDLAVFTQCHFFAGIAGWPLALALAGWPADRPVWTGSCPCQPFSVAGKRKGNSDERHLWPYFYKLISERKPDTCFGEQVASKDGREWLSGVRTDLETVGYVVGAADLCAASAGAPHIRQRLYWVADASISRLHDGDAGDENKETLAAQIGRKTGVRDISDASNGGAVDGLGDPIEPGLEGFAGNGDDGDQPGRDSAQPGGPITAPGGFDFWGDFDLVHCRDGKTRRIESGTFPLAHGVPGRVGKLRAYGNAILPQVAARFIEAFLEAAP